MNLIASIVCASLMLVITSCQPSTKTIGEEVKALLQGKFASDDQFKDYHLAVSKVDVVHETENKYRGIATVEMNGKSYSVPLSILADGNKVMYEADPSAFAFLITAVLQNGPDDPSSRPEDRTLGFKAGWSRAQLAEFSAGCIDSIAESAKREYKRREAQSGRGGVDYPEKAVRDSIETMCVCISRRIAQSWTYAKFVRNEQAYAQPLVEEAIAGGRCKPDGVLGEVLESEPGE